MVSSCYVPAGAQLAPERSGAIIGTVTHQTAAIPVPARITATEVTTGKCYTTTADSNGAYRLPNIPEGSYWLVSEAAQDRSTVKSLIKPAVQVTASQETVRSIQIPASDNVKVCTESCVVETTGIQDGSDTSLRIYADHSVASPGSELWLTVTITNTSSHFVLIDSETPDKKFSYHLYAFGFCGCPGRLGQRDRKSDSDTTMRSAKDRRHSPALRLPPGGSLTHKVDLSKLIDLSQPETYVIEAKRGDVSDTEHAGKSKNDEFERSNSISVAVMAQPSSARELQCESRSGLQK